METRASLTVANEGEDIVFREELPRLYELRDCIAAPASSDAYFRDFDQNLARSAHVKDVYLRQERVLQRLDDQAWEHLKGEALPRLTAHDKRGRGWQQLFDILNEARAYNYLKSLGCTDLRYIPRSHEKTPDLEGSLALGRVLCEVKTINISDQEIAFRTYPFKARSIPTIVADGFLKKLRATVETAKLQLMGFDGDHAAIHFVYLNVCFDDFLAELKEAYFKQIDDDLAKTQVIGIRLVICNDHTPFYKPLEMRFADVDNIG
jgi:hypothetical protein